MIPRRTSDKNFVFPSWTPPVGTSSSDWLLPKGEMGTLIADYSWETSPFGGLETWPFHLRMMVNLMLESAAPMAIIWGKDFRLLYNDRYGDIIQDKHPGALGAPSEEIFPELWSAINPLFKRALAGEAIVVEDYLLGITRRGQTKEGVFSFSYNPIRNENREVDGFLALVVETTARVALEQERAKVFETTLSTITDFAYSFDREGRFLFVNKSLLDLWGLKLEDALGKNFFDLKYPSGLAERLQRQIDEVFRTKQVLVDETPYTSPAGVVGYYEYIFSPVVKADGQVDTVVGSTRDVSKRKYLENTLSFTVEELRSAKESLQSRAGFLEIEVRERTAKMEESMSQLETFSYSISHDLRAPLRVMQSYARLVDQGSGDLLSPDNRSYLRRIITASDRMDCLIQDVLIYSRLSQGELTLEPIDLPKLLKEILETYPQFQTPSPDIRILLPIPLVLGNPAALVQCFSNILNNAFKFVAEGITPRVEVWADSSYPMVTVFIKDNGIGIAPHLHLKIFEMFQQLDADREGTGIGLTVAKRVAERMGGSIGLTSLVGTGSTFFVTLRMAPL